MKKTRFLLPALLGIGLCVFMARHGASRHMDWESITRWATIGNAINAFSRDHGDQLPSKLSELVPQYIRYDDLSLFYSSEMRAAPGVYLPSDWKRAPELVDTCSDCAYVGLPGIARGVLAYERSGEWNQVAGHERRIIIPPGGGVHTVTEAELNQLLHDQPSAVLERWRKERVIYYHANLHASLNEYRDEFGRYPTGDNAAVTRALRGDNPAKKRFHFSYAQERSPAGEDLDPWGTPYFVASDGELVRIRSAAGNRVLDRPGSPGYDDICLSLEHGSEVGADDAF